MVSLPQLLVLVEDLQVLATCSCPRNALALLIFLKASRSYCGNYVNAPSRGLR